MQRRVCMQVRVVLLASACDSTRECEEFYSRVRVLLLTDASKTPCKYKIPQGLDYIVAS